MVISRWPRPLNTMPVDEKTTEVIIKVKFIENNEILSLYQSVGRAKHLCETTIKYIINNWKFALEPKKDVRDN